MERAKRRSLGKKKVWIGVLLFLFFVGVFAILGASIETQTIRAFDSAVIYRMQAASPSWLTSLMLFFTFLASVKALVVLAICTALTMFWQKKRWEALFLAVALGGGMVFNLLLKELFRRERPDLHRLIEEGGYSFPSGHSMASFLFYGMVAVFLYLFVVSRLAKLGIVLAAVILIACVGASRIYLGVHYPSDVLAGYAAGGAWLVLCLLGMHLVLERRRSKKHRSN